MLDTHVWKTNQTPPCVIPKVPVVVQSFNRFYAEFHRFTRAAHDGSGQDFCLGIGLYEDGGGALHLSNTATYRGNDHRNKVFSRVGVNVAGVGAAHIDDSVFVKIPVQIKNGVIAIHIHVFQENNFFCTNNGGQIKVDAR